MFNVTIENNKYIIKGKVPQALIKEIPSIQEEGADYYSCPLLSYSSFSLATYAMKNKKNINLGKDVGDTMVNLARQVQPAKAFLTKEQGQVFISIPPIPSYESLVKSLKARHRRLTTYSVPQSRLYEFFRIVASWRHPFLPSVAFTNELKEYLTKDFGLSNDLNSLFSTDLKELYSVEYGYEMNNDKVKKAKKKLKADTIGELILSRPRRYEDRTAIMGFKSSPYGMTNIFRVQFIEFSPSYNASKMIFFKARDTIDNVIVNCQMFGGGYLKSVFREGDILNITGIKKSGNVITISQLLTDDEVKGLPIAPIYNASPSNGFTNKVMTYCTTEILTRFSGDDLFFYVKSKDKFWNSVKSLHYPKDINNYSDAIDNLAYFELVALQLLFLDKKMKGNKPIGIPKGKVDDGYFDKVLKTLPFNLTEGQANAIKVMQSKLSSTQPADVLLSGDVGSGKSLIATLLALYVVDNKQQVAIVGPTEVLAKQLYSSVLKTLKSLNNAPKVTFVSSSLSNEETRIAQHEIKMGRSQIIVGTHSLFNLEYNNLGFVVIDEQQKFGANQRDKLKHFGRNDGKVPDILSQTATPIPRSTAQAFYGDIDLIQVLDKPAGRKEIKTSWFKEDSKTALTSSNSPVWKLINQEIEKDNQVFVICPAVEANEDKNFISVKEVQKIMNKINKNVAQSIHGSLKKETQNKRIKDFRDKKFPVLIGSSILEVGIDIPDATAIIILDADRFGASSLHQIRGRVGRNDKQSYCLLVSNSENPTAKTRLDALVNTNNGFEIAMVDLKVRKEGDILGVRQSGESNLRFCNFVDHTRLIELAQAEALRLFKSPLKAQALQDAKNLLIKEEG